MNATERLRQLLDERGVEWRGGLPTETVVDAPIDVLYVGLPDGVMRAFIRSYLTPEQAVEATLGRGTCKNVSDFPKYEFVCSACGGRLDILDEFDNPTVQHADGSFGPRYCPNCGRRVVS